MSARIMNTINKTGNIVPCLVHFQNIVLSLILLYSKTLQLPLQSDKKTVFLV
jgi:hypothetical protein